MTNLSSEEVNRLADHYEQSLFIEENWKTLKPLIDEVGGQDKLYYLPWRRHEPNPTFDQAFNLSKEMFDLLNNRVLGLSNGNYLVPVPDVHKVNHVKELKLYDGDQAEIIKKDWFHLKKSIETTAEQNRRFHRLYSQAFADDKTLHKHKRNLEYFPPKVQEAERLFTEMSRTNRLTNMELFDKLEDKVMILSGETYLVPIPNMYSGNYVQEMMDFTDEASLQKEDEVV